MDIWSLFRRRQRAATNVERNAVAQAIAERRYGLAEELCRKLPEGSDLRQIFALQLLIAQSRYEEAAAFYESGSRTMRAQHSSRVRYLRALSAMKRMDDLEKTVKAIFASRAEPENLAGLLPFMPELPPQTRAAAAEKILSAGKPLPLDVQIACAQTLLDTGNVDRAKAICAALPPPTPRQKAEIAILQSNIALGSGDNVRAVRYLSDAFVAFGLEPVSLRDPGAALSPENVVSQATAPAEMLPRTSVLMSCFNAEHSVGAAIASLQAQSHRDIEIIVVDDGSTDRSAGVVEAIAAADPRVRLVRLRENRGTYYARNTALAQATGIFALAHDADDWAHPRKVERLVRHLIAKPDLIAVRGYWLRFAVGIGVVHRTQYIRLDASSLTFRREPALAKAGYFDSVRSGADSEYTYRLKRLFGENAVGELQELLSFASYTPTSLSRTSQFDIDINTGVYAPLRAAYRRAFFHWHEHAGTLRVDFPPNGERPFPVPPELSR